MRDVGHVVALRSRRLESLFGARLDDLEARHVRGLVDAGAEEAFDLNFKATTYGQGGSERRALTGDVAALANTAGGVIVISVEEDNQAHAAAAPGIEITDGEMNRIRQVVASWAAPMPMFDVIPVMNDLPGNGRGFLVLAVPRSPGALHAVLANGSLRYPKRNGAMTRYLSEPEVATAYRERLSGVAQQTQRIFDIEKAATARLGRDEPCFTPTGRGHTHIASATSLGRREAR